MKQSIFPDIILIMDIRGELERLGLSPESAVVIGSGILNALHLRESKDIDVVVREKTYKKLKRSGRFQEKFFHSCKVLRGGLFEIGTSWGVLGRIWRFADLEKQSTVINGVRYIKIEFLLRVKKSWIADGKGRKKDLEDVRLIEKYLSSA